MNSNDTVQAKKRRKRVSSEQTFRTPLPFLEIRTTLDSVGAYADHFHESLSVGLILGGSTRVRCNGKEHIAEKGDIVLIGPGCVHSCNPLEGRPRSYHMLYLDRSWCLEQLPGASVGKGTLLPRLKIVRDAGLFRELSAAVGSLDREGGTPEGDAFVRLIGGLLRAYGDDEDECAKPVGAANLLRARERLAQDLEDSLSVAETAERAGVRRETFSRSFRRMTGLPPGMYRHCKRLEYARGLLRRGCGIAEAALSAGYADQSHFHRMFVKYFSVTPGCYHKQRSLSFKK